MPNKKWTVHRLHKWVGLTAAIWLIVLGVTGLLLDHRDTWRWLWQSGVSESFINNVVVDKSKSGQIKYYQINPTNTQQHVAGGLTGLWWSKNEGQDWNKTNFVGVDKTPMISTVLFSSENKLWIASDEGLWLSSNSGISASQVELAGSWVSAISVNNEKNILIGVTERTKIFKYSINTKEIRFIDIKSVSEKELPKSISLSRFSRDIHYGRGVFDSSISLLWNDFSAIALIILPLSGFLFYWLPKKWKRNIQQNKKVAHAVKKHSIRWLFRVHGPLFGLLSFIPIIYLSITGILLDHSKELRGWMKTTQVTQSWQTPVYKLNSWQDEIYGVVDYPESSTKFSVATRLGLFTTLDDGESWQREKLLNNKSAFIWTLRRFDKTIFIGGMGSPNMVKMNNKPWTVVKKVGHMPSDITLDEKSNWLWKSRHGISAGKLDSGFKKQNLELPTTEYIPWFYIVDGLHSGIIIHTQWKWVNDFFAVLAILLVISGLIRWWHKKWI